MNLEKLIAGVVKRLLSEYDGFNLDSSDLISEGYLIAVEQMSSYKPNTGATVSTYLFSQVTGRLRNYVNRVLLKDMHGTEGMRRVSMELVDQEVSLETDHENRMALDEFRMTLQGEQEKQVFDMLRSGWSYREISATIGIATGSITNIMKEWKV